MKNIRKNAEPRDLVEWRATPGADFHSMRKDAVRESLYREQGGLCCYCMNRIVIAKTRIEHWQSIFTHPKRQLDYANLLLACDGGGENSSNPHCDVSKKERPLKWNPADPNHDVEAKIGYARDGTILCEGDNAFQTELCQVLKLNDSILKRNRMSVREAVTDVLSRKDGTATRAALQKYLNIWKSRDSDGLYRPYCQVAVHYLKKKLSTR